MSKTVSGGHGINIHVHILSLNVFQWLRYSMWMIKVCIERRGIDISNTLGVIRWDDRHNLANKSPVYFFEWRFLFVSLSGTSQPPDQSELAERLSSHLPGSDSDMPGPSNDSADNEDSPDRTQNSHNPPSNSRINDDRPPPTDTERAQSLSRENVDILYVGNYQFWYLHPNKTHRDMRAEVHVLKERNPSLVPYNSLVITNHHGPPTLFRYRLYQTHWKQSLMQTLWWQK